MQKHSSSILEDSFEKVAEFGGKVVKKAGKTIAQTINPFAIAQKIVSGETAAPQTQTGQEQSKNNNQKHSPLDLSKLQQSYTKQDAQKTEALKNRLFQLVKRGDEEQLERKKYEKNQQQQKMLVAQQEKKRKDEERKKQEQAADIPKGKQRRSIFSPKKVAQRQHVEIRADSGKQ